MLEIALFAGSSLLLYHLGFGFFLFLIPFQVLAVRKGAGSMWASEALAFAALAAIRLIRTLRAPAGGGAWVLTGLELAIVAVLLLALSVANLPALGGWRALYRVLLAAGAAGVLFTPLAVILPGNQAFLKEMEGLFTAVTGSMKALLTVPDGEGAAWIAGLLEPGTLMKLSGEYVLRSYLPDSLAILGFSWWAGTSSGERSLGQRTNRRTPRLAAFRMPPRFIWAFLASWAAAAADLALGLGAASYLAWNLAIATLLLYGVQGIAIFRFLFEKHRIGMGWWVLLLLGIAILLASPSINVIFLFGIPLLGVSEQWITYRIPERSE